LQNDRMAASCSGVVKIYWTATGEVHALKGIDAHFDAGAVTALVGPSGSGKSSLLRILAGMDKPSAGKVEIAGIDLSEATRSQMKEVRRQMIGYVFQRPSDNLVPYLTAWEHLEAAASFRGSKGVPRGKELMGILGLGDRMDHKPEQLSGGEQQRLAFAQAVIGNPAVVLADEPTAELDTHSASSLLTEVSDLVREENIAFILTTHDPKVVKSADRILHLRHGNLEAETGLGRQLSVIDATGRVQLPPEALRLFPGNRAILTIENGEVRITPP
jgi:putative ABC transport system ATP-binding protein